MWRDPELLTCRAARITDSVLPVVRYTDLIHLNDPSVPIGERGTHRGMFPHAILKPQCTMSTGDVDIFSLNMPDNFVSLMKTLKTNEQVTLLHEIISIICILSYALSGFWG